jgi:hypothetical protein
MPFQNFSMHPASSVFHYGLEVRPRASALRPQLPCAHRRPLAQCFEGMKAYVDGSNRIRLFRPDVRPVLP